MKKIFLIPLFLILLFQPLYAQLLALASDNDSERIKRIEEKAFYIFVDDQGNIHDHGLKNNSENHQEDVYRDSFYDIKPPKTKVKFLEKHFIDPEKTYNQKATIIEITSVDRSGVRNIIYSINDSSCKLYEEPIEVSQSGLYRLKYYAIDDIGNVEIPKVVRFSINNFSKS
ncbi:MAG TPA: OmpL47-type beta-barrel domain-containing protein [Cyclobacteriaceae bacterium]